ncbi:MAG TPA: hypothetical protein PKW33_15430 [Anaerolineaceae bacterium]|mgnify:CR=1 FL=1|nr:hypothetical protein [Anaerolineaceae bacterium]HPN52986.1 hypothetical protein [Anaerolineaceae bacterium]
MTLAIITPIRLTSLTYIRVAPESSIDPAREQAVLLPPGADVSDVLMRVTETLIDRMKGVTIVTLACNGLTENILEQ